MSAITYAKVLDLFKETDRKFQETERQIKEMQAETARQIKEINRRHGDLANRLGEFVQEMVRPAVVRLLRERAIEFTRTIANDGLDGEDGFEIDVLVINGGDCVAIECKSKLTTEDVRDHLLRLARIKKRQHEMGEIAGKRLLGGVATMVLEREAHTFAQRHGLFVFAQNGDALELKNPPDFRPSYW